MRVAAVVLLVCACDAREQASRPPTPAPAEAPPAPTTPAPSGPGTTLGAADAPADCTDPVAGVWVARTHVGSRWHEHRLTIERVAGDLRATQVTRFWDGPLDQLMPPRCGADRRQGVVEMTDEIEWIEGILRVRGVTIDRARGQCGFDVSDYHLDDFTGPVRGSTYDAVNNDGSGAVNRPYRFRRIACLDGP